ncbi:MAG: TSUP family transporter [Clostridia bacterium]|nr:TSUP family transporter [Clostridia bacterium]
MELTWQSYVVVCPLIFLAGLVDAVAGGGGLISLPAYYAAGLPPYLASGTNKLSACMGATAATARYLISGRVALLTGVLAAAGALPGSWLGAETQRLIPEQTVRLMMLILIPMVAVLMLRRRGELKEKRRVPEKAAAPVSFAIGLVIGFYDGLVGPGTGTFLILLFVCLLGIDPVSASGTARVVNLASNVAALVSYWAGGYVLWQLAIPAGLCAVAGGLTGAGLTLKKGSAFIQKMLLVVLALLLIKMAADTLSAWI